MTQTRKQKGARAGGACCSLESVLSPKLFKALCDPNRLAILARLGQLCAPCTVSEIAACCPVDLSVVSRHLAQLREAGILRAEKRGKAVYYAVRAEELVRTLRSIADAIERCCVAPSEDARTQPDSAPPGRARRGEPR